MSSSSSHSLFLIAWKDENTLLLFIFSLLRSVPSANSSSPCLNFLHRPNSFFFPLRCSHSFVHTKIHKTPNLSLAISHGNRIYPIRNIESDEPCYQSTHMNGSSILALSRYSVLLTEPHHMATNFECLS